MLIKKEAASLWCSRASDHYPAHGGNPWKYLIISHDIITDNRTLAGFAAME